MNNPDSTTDETMTMAAAWREVTESGSEGGSSHLVPFDPSAAGGILDELERLESESLASPDPLKFLRSAMAERFDRKISSEKLRRMSPSAGEENAADLPAQSLELVVADCDIQIAALRTYCRRRYGDEHERDWFEAYMELSTFFHGRMGAERSQGADATIRFDGSQWAIDRKTFQACKRRCIDAPVGKRFESFDRP